jgi:hypothetical protein
MPDQPYAKELAAVLEAIGKREGATPPDSEAVWNAERLLATRRLSLQCSPAEIHYVEDDGRRHMVAVYAHNGQVLDAECSCDPSDQAAPVCPHLLAVLAACGKPLTT